MQIKNLLYFLFCLPFFYKIKTRRKDQRASHSGNARKPPGRRGIWYFCLPFQSSRKNSNKSSKAFFFLLVHSPHGVLVLFVTLCSGVNWSLDQVLTINLLREEEKSFWFEAKPFSAVTEFFCSNLRNRRSADWGVSIVSCKDAPLKLE